MKQFIKAAGIVGMMTVVLFPGVARAQSSTAGAIAGLVKDGTGAVLPGVTVEVSSPALIEKVRSVVTDGQGNYKIVDLRPGTYSVTFTLTGFTVIKREGVELTTGFTATANAEMSVGSVAETVTVTGASPIVDVQNVRTQTVYSREVLDAVPSAKTDASFIALTLGAVGSATQHDVGGNKGEGPVGASIHGSRTNDQRIKIDGMSIHGNSGDGGGVNHVYHANVVAMQETALETGGMSAESETGGVQMNYVPRDGSNAFNVYSSVSISGHSLQSSNLDDTLRARGLTTASSAKSIYDAGVGVGGPLMKDRIWFYTAQRWWGASEYQPGAYFNANQGKPSYAPDLSRPAYTDNHFRDHSVRVSWQLSQRNKLSALNSYQRSCLCFMGVSASVAPEGTTSLSYRPLNLTQVVWNFPATNRILVDAGFSGLKNIRFSTPAPGVTADAIGISDSLLGITYGSFASLGATAYAMQHASSSQANGKASVSYVTGSHAVKAGFMVYKGWDHQDRIVNQSLSYTLRGGVPLSVTEWASPILSDEQILNAGFYGQDQWTIRRLTLNYGARFDFSKGRVLPAAAQATRWLSARQFDGVEDVPRWTDVSPRVGVAYDLLGNGKTSAKFSIGRYVQSIGVGIADATNPQFALTTNAVRSWSDSNNDFVPDCELTNRAANGECGALSSTTFGQPVITTRYASDVLSGFGVRPFNWQVSASVQQELREGMAVTVGYFRTWFGNFSVTDNLLLSPGDFNPFCVTVPQDARLPGGGGNQLCGLYDVSPAQFGQLSNSVTQASHFGKYQQQFDGIDISANVRFGAGGMVRGGIALGRTVTDTCLTVDAPGLFAQAAAPAAGTDARPGFCRVVVPWWRGTGGQLKFNVVYPLPLGISASAAFENSAGIPLAATNVYRSTDVIGSLGRNLASGASGSVTVPILAPQTLFEKRLNQLDARLGKTLKFGKRRLTGTIDLYNITNASAILSVTTTYGPNWLRPGVVQGGRLVKFGAVVDF